MGAGANSCRGSPRESLLEDKARVFIPRLIVSAGFFTAHHRRRRVAVSLDWRETCDGSGNWSNIDSRNGRTRRARVMGARACGRTTADARRSRPGRAVEPTKASYLFHDGYRPTQG